MIVMCRIDETLQCGLEIVFIAEGSTLDLLLESIEAFLEINCGLLIARRWRFQVRKGALELDSIVIAMIAAVSTARIGLKRTV